VGSESDQSTGKQQVLELGSKDLAKSPYLIVISGSAAGRLIRLSRLEMTLGRGNDADIVIDDPSISRKHVRLANVEGGLLRVTDLGSTNGTYFNGARIDSATLNDGDKIQVGSATLLKFSYQHNLEAEFQDQLYQSAIKDALTGAFNRRYFQDRIAEEFAYAHRHEAPLSLCFLDIDHFKRVNDTFGHLAGDAVLAKLAHVIHGTLRREDIFCRYGGEEFSVILREIDDRAARAFAERLRKAIERADFSKPELGMKSPFPITVSIGLATFRDRNFQKASELVAEADRALYKAKEAGRNCIV
jgi:diguanylate cyclase (GGDEF)-like protein